MSSNPAPAFQATDDRGYYANARADLVAQLPRPLGRVLDVGCGAGEVGRALRAAGAETVVGIEINADAAAAAPRRGPRRRRRDPDRRRHAPRAVRHDRALRCDRAPRRPRSAARRVGAIRRRGCPAARLRSERAALLAAARPDPARHVRLHRLGPPRPHASALVHAAGHRGARRAHGWRIERVEPSILGRNRIVDRVTGGRTREFIALQWSVLAHR